MFSGAAALIVATLAGGLWLFVDVLLVYAVIRRRTRLPDAWRRRAWLALLPPLAPWFGWRVGSRALAGAWGVLAAVYAAARLSM